MKEYIEFGKVLFLQLELSDIKDIYKTKGIPVNYSRSGYGSKIPTQYMIKTIDNREHRVYCICYSNNGSLYIRYKKNNMVMIESAMNNWQIANKIYF
jgi:hypothetical protein